MRSTEHDVGKARVMFLGTVRGLVREAAEVRAAVAAFSPDAIALAVGPRELEEIEQTLQDKGELSGSASPKRKKKGKNAKESLTGPTGIRNTFIAPDGEDSAYDDFGLFVSGSDMAFLRKLSKFGDVEMPPPSYQEAVLRGRARDIPVVCVDLDDEAYTEVFVTNVSLWALMRQGDRMTKIGKKRTKAEDAESFAFEWDRWENKVKGYMRVQQAREEKVAAGVAALCGEHARVMAIVEVERLEGIERALRTVAGAAGFAAAPSKEESRSRA